MINILPDYTRQLVVPPNEHENIYYELLFMVMYLRDDADESDTELLRQQR
jgi:hypothetical protein